MFFLVRSSALGRMCEFGSPESDKWTQAKAVLTDQLLKAFVQNLLLQNSKLCCASVASSFLMRNMWVHFSARFQRRAALIDKRV